MPHFRALPPTANQSLGKQATPSRDNHDNHGNVVMDGADVFYTPRSSNAKDHAENTVARRALSKLPRPSQTSSGPTLRSFKDSSPRYNYVPTASRLALRRLDSNGSASNYTSTPATTAGRDPSPFTTPTRPTPQAQKKIPVANDKPLPSPPALQVISTSPQREGRTLIDATERSLRHSVGTPYEEEWPSLTPTSVLQSKISDELSPHKHRNVSTLKRSSTTASIASIESSTASIRTAKTCVTQKAPSPVTVSFSGTGTASFKTLSGTNFDRNRSLHPAVPRVNRNIVNFSRPHSFVYGANGPTPRSSQNDVPPVMRTASWSGPKPNRDLSAACKSQEPTTNKDCTSSKVISDNSTVASGLPIARDGFETSTKDRDISRIRTLTSGKAPATLSAKLTIRKGAHKILTGEDSTGNLLEGLGTEGTLAKQEHGNMLDRSTCELESPSKSSISSHKRKASPHSNLLMKGSSPAISVPDRSPKRSSNMTKLPQIGSASEKKKNDAPTIIPVTYLSPRKHTQKANKSPPITSSDKINKGKVREKSNEPKDKARSTSRFRRFFSMKRASTPDCTTTLPVSTQARGARNSRPPLPRRNSARLRSDVVARPIPPSLPLCEIPPKVPPKASGHASDRRYCNTNYTQHLQIQFGAHSPRANNEKAKNPSHKALVKPAADTSAPRKLAHSLLQHAKALPASSPDKPRLLNMAEVLVKTIVASNDAEVSRVRAEEGAKEARIASGVAKGALKVMVAMVSRAGVVKKNDCVAEKKR